MSRRKFKPFSFRAAQKSRRSTARKSSQIGFESLEKREVMASNVVGVLAGGVLTVEGTPGVDHIAMFYEGGSVRINGASIWQNGFQKGSVPASSLSSIVVNSLGGNDVISILGGSPIPMTVNGGWGDDTIDGGVAGDRLFGNQEGDGLALSFDRSLQLHVPLEGESLNWGGKQEKWLWSTVSGWHFITPDGKLWKQTQAGTANGSLVTQLNPQFYKDTSLLTEAETGPLAANLDRSLGLTFLGHNYTNSGGKGEKWFNSASGAWHFITPDGTLYRQTAYGFAVGTQVAKLDPTYWANPDKLASAMYHFTDRDTIRGNMGDDAIRGGVDNDKIIGGYGGDFLYGEEGDDTIFGGDEANSLTQAFSDDADAIYGGNGNDVLHGGGDADSLYGETGYDVLWGEMGNDNLHGGVGNDALYGLDGNDRLWGGYGTDHLMGGKGDDQLWGEMDADYLNGEAGNDVLWGGWGADTLRGGENNDRLYGEQDVDLLYGDQGDDWLDAGSAAEFADGGKNNDGTPERDINAFVTAVNGAYYGDIIQGSADNCWILAAMGAASRYEDLSKRITYQGNDTYAVRLFNRNSPTQFRNGEYHSEIQYVKFDGSPLGSDPGFNSQEGETWQIIMARAILQAVCKWDLTQNMNTPHSGGALDAFSMLFGTRGVISTPAGIGSVQALSNLLYSGKMAVAHSKSATSALVRNHAYTIVGVQNNNVMLYNPWGSFVTITWAQFVNDVTGIHIA